MEGRKEGKIYPYLVLLFVEIIGGKKGKGGLSFMQSVSPFVYLFACTNLMSLL